MNIREKDKGNGIYRAGNDKKAPQCTDENNDGILENFYWRSKMINLFTPVEIKKNKIKNRIVMPPMVCFKWSDDFGFVSEKHINHYEKRAQGGTGTIIIEATCVNKEGRLADSQLGLWSDEHIEGISKIAKACHKYSAVVLVQIHHAGLKTPANVCKPALAPSDFEDEKTEAVALSLEQIKEIQADFINAAIRAEKAGLDGIELHGAHGYLINQFASPVTNKRSDQYGGTIENRMNFVCEIIEGIKQAVDEKFIIGYRMGGNEPTLENGIEIAKILEASGVDLIHVSAGISSGETPTVPEGFPNNWIVYMGTEIRKNVNVPVIVVNGINNPKQAAYLIENNLADFTAVGKAMLTDSEWANKAMSGEMLKPCLSCIACQWFRNGALCPQDKG